MDDLVADLIFVDAPASAVHAALCSPHEILEWFDAIEAVIGAWPDGEFTALREDGSRVTAVVDSVTPEGLRLRECVWEIGGEQHGPSRVEFSLREADGGVWLSVRHSEIGTGAAADQFAAYARRVWVGATVAIKRRVEGI